MKRNTIPLLIAACGVGLGLLAGHQAAMAQTGGGYDLTWNTADGGGATFATGGYSLGATIGQADAGTSAGGAYALSGGFWYDSFIRVFVPSTRRDAANGW